jgi:hypothetical protein
MSRLTAAQQEFARRNDAVLGGERNFVPGHPVFMYRAEAAATDRWLVDSTGLAIEHVCFRRSASSG